MTMEQAILIGFLFAVIGYMAGFVFGYGTSVMMFDRKEDRR